MDKPNTYFIRQATNNDLSLKLPLLCPVSEVQTIAASYSVKFSNNNPNLCSACDESGELYLLNSQNQPEIIGQMHAHNNSIFHTSWSSDDKYLLTGSGDQTAGVWDMQKFTGCLFVKHTGSVKCIKNSPVMKNVYATASRDGKIYIWDIRTNGLNNNRDTIYEPVAEITQRSEVSIKKRKNPASFTGFEYMSWGNVIVSVEADESGMRFWDIRRTESVKENNKKTRRSKPCIGLVTPWTYKQREKLKTITIKKSKDSFSDFGIQKKINEAGSGNTWINAMGNSLLVSSMNNAMYLYKDILRLDIDPPIKFVGHKTSFYVKGCISPDLTHVASGSSEGSLYIWDINQPEKPYIMQTRYMVESSCVDWSQNDHNFIATCSDAALVTFWDFDEYNLN